MNKIFIIFIFAFITQNTHAQKGWISLFDGKTLNGWKKVAGSANYAIEDGAILGTTVINSPNTFLITDKEYGDFV